MHIVIIGLGSIGQTILKNLSSERHELTLIDENKEKIVVGNDEEGIETVYRFLKEKGYLA